MKQPITLVLLGDIAAGKGTQAKLLVRRFRLKLIETGAFTRKYWTGSSKVSRRLEKTKLGKLTPSDIIKKFLASTLAKLPRGQSVLLDGGKMPSEARLVYRLFREQERKILVIYLTIPKSEIFRRLNERFYCSRTGELVTLRGRTAGKRCPRCRAPLIKRADDDPRAIRNRLDYYDKIYRQTVAFWKSKKLLKLIDGRGSILAVNRRLVSALKKYFAV